MIFPLHIFRHLFRCKKALSFGGRGLRRNMYIHIYVYFSLHYIYIDITWYHHRPRARNPPVASPGTGVENLQGPSASRAAWHCVIPSSHETQQPQGEERKNTLRIDPTYLGKADAKLDHAFVPVAYFCAKYMQQCFLFLRWCFFNIDFLMAFELKGCKGETWDPPNFFCLGGLLWLNTLTPYIYIYLSLFNMIHPESPYI